jgi:hypothetical protein
MVDGFPFTMSDRGRALSASVPLAVASGQVRQHSSVLGVRGISPITLLSTFIINPDSG